jgi:hypothetical protein
MPSTRISKHLRNSSQATPSASVFPLPPLKASNEWLAALHYALLRPREQLILSLRTLRPGMPFTVAGSIFSGKWGQTGRSLKLVPAHCLAASLFLVEIFAATHPNERRFSRLPFLLHRRILFPRAENRTSKQSPKPVSFRMPAEFRNAERRQERNPENLSSPMPLQGISSMLSPFNFISLPQFCARSSHRGLVFSMRSIFFFRRHDLICFSRLIMPVTSLHPA